MSYVLNYCNTEKDSDMIEAEMRNVIAFYSDDDWLIDSCTEVKSYAEKYRSHSQIDMSCFDVTKDGSVGALEELRKFDKSAMLILISDATVSPLKYMKPALMAGALMLKPLSKSMIADTVKEVFNEIITTEQVSDGKKFCVETKSGQKLLPYDKILFFEAREKKIFLNMECEEIAFYSSLDVLEKSLPENFVRCHRSFIVNKNKITQIVFAQNIIYCNSDICIPLSRSCKPMLKELMEAKNFGK